MMAADMKRSSSVSKDDNNSEEPMDTDDINDSSEKANTPTDTPLWPPVSGKKSAPRNDVAAISDGAANVVSRSALSPDSETTSSSVGSEKINGAVERKKSDHEAGSHHTDNKAFEASEWFSEEEDKGSEGQTPDAHLQAPVIKGVPIKDLDKLKECHLPRIDRSWEAACASRIGSSGMPAWDNQHVRMPYADSRAGNRWKRIKETLSNMRQKLESRSDDVIDLWYFKKIICIYNESYKDKWDFDGFDMYVKSLPKSERSRLLDTLCKMAELACDLAHICPEPIPLLRKGQNKSITLTKLQIACLLANAFYCTFPMRNQKPPRGRSSNQRPDILPLPSINFSSLFKMAAEPSRQAQINKLKCVMNYFHRVTSDRPLHGKVTFERKCLTKHVDWQTDASLFTRLHASTEGRIEIEGAGMLQVDFANKLVGGGVLGRGCVQEEIRFLGFTELIVSRLFTEELDDRDCLVVSGCEQYNDYRGYSNRFTWCGDHRDQTASDRSERRLAQVVIIDAVKYYVPENQFSGDKIDRELNKAYCGFCDDDHGALPAVATGNWGCGDFRGDRQLKSLIQLMAAAKARRDVCYFTYHDGKLVEELHKVHELIRRFELTVGDVYRIILQFMQVQQMSQLLGNLFDYILRTYGPVTTSSTYTVDTHF